MQLIESKCPHWDNLAIIFYGSHNVGKPIELREVLGLNLNDSFLIGVDRLLRYCILLGLILDLALGAGNINQQVLGVASQWQMIKGAHLILVLRQYGRQLLEYKIIGADVRFKCSPPEEAFVGEFVMPFEVEGHRDVVWLSGGIDAPPEDKLVRIG
jgi:hypothetical protein